MHDDHFAENKGSRERYETVEEDLIEVVKVSPLRDNHLVEAEIASEHLHIWEDLLRTSCEKVFVSESYEAGQQHGGIRGLQVMLVDHHYVLVILAALF